MTPPPTHTHTRAHTHTHHIHVQQMGQAGHLRLRDITLSRIPHLRSFVNDALLDVLYFMSPAYHQVLHACLHCMSFLVYTYIHTYC